MILLFYAAETEVIQVENARLSILVMIHYNSHSFPSKSIISQARPYAAGATKMGTKNNLNVANTKTQPVDYPLNKKNKRLKTQPRIRKRTDFVSTLRV
jgi:hypothetical protein